MKKAVALLLFILLASFAFAQQRTHTVQPKETIYGISKQYNVSQEDLKRANPFLNERGLQIGDVLVIPGGAETSNADGRIKQVVTNEQPLINTDVIIPTEDANFIYIKIKPQQTIYSLTREYDITESALKSLNPQLADGLKAGDIIRIPKKSQDQKEEITPEGMYKVQRGDTVYSLAQRFNVSTDQFYIANPSVQIEGLVVDSYVNIPKREKSTGVFQDGFIEHKVKQGETIYSITKLYKVSFSEILNLNPHLTEGLKAGMTLRIPLEDGANIIISDKIKRINDREINIGLILPFHLDATTNKPKESEIATDIFIGAKVALDSLARKGKKLNLTVLDSKNDASEIETLMTEHNFSKFDAIVGPLFASNFRSLAERLEGSGIALVSPLSNAEDLTNYENTVIATPSDEAIADAVIQKIKEEYRGQAIQILTDERHLNLAEYVSSNLQRNLRGAQISITQDANKLHQPSEAVNETLSDGTMVEMEYFTPIITILVSGNNSLGQAYVNRIKTMDAENLRAYGVKFVSAYDIYNPKNKENIDALKNIDFTFGTIRIVNVYGDSERNTLNKFMDVYCLMPNEYQQIGFDIIYDLGERMNASGDVLNALNTEQTRLSTKFQYEKVGKGYVNQSVRTLRIFVADDESPDSESIAH